LTTTGEGRGVWTVSLYADGAVAKTTANAVGMIAQLMYRFTFLNSHIPSKDWFEYSFRYLNPIPKKIALKEIL
jgi:hypothetical protein